MTSPIFRHKANVTKVADGISLTLDLDLGFSIGRSKQKIDLYGIKVPLARGTGKASRDYLKNRVLGKQVVVESREGPKGWHSVVHLDGVNINQELVELGYAEPIDEDELVSEDVTVSSKAALLTALAALSIKGGAVHLEAGNYGKLDLYAAVDSFVKFPNEVTIKSADIKNPAVFEFVRLRGVENLTFEGVTFKYNFKTDDPEWVRPFTVEANSRNITFTNSKFIGDHASGVSSVLDGFATGTGLYVRDSKQIKVTNNEFSKWLRGLIFHIADDLVMSGNEIHSIRSDGCNFVQVNRVRIEGNHYHDFKAAPLSKDHQDMIQFWTAGTKNPSTDIVIRDNFLNSGAGDWTQSIFIRNEVVDQGLAGREMFYKNITIENNIIHNAHANAIWVGEVDGLVVGNNTLLHNQDTASGNSMWVPKIQPMKAASQNVTIRNNVTPYPVGKPKQGWVFENNLLVQRDNPAGGNFIGDLFVNALAGKDATLKDFAGVPGGLVEQLQVGSSLPTDQ